MIVSWDPVTDGKYGIELQTFDNLGNGSEMIEFEVTVGDEGLPKLMLSKDGDSFVLSWQMENGGDDAILQWTDALNEKWSDVDSGGIAFGGAGRIYKEKAKEEGERFYRLIKR